MDMNCLTKEAFMDGPLVRWFKESFVDDSERKNILYEDLVDGFFIQKALLETISKVKDANVYDTSCDETTEVVPPNGEPSIRSRNLAEILKNLKKFYEIQDFSCIYLIVELPDVDKLARDPERNVKEATLLLFHLLSCWQWVYLHNNNELFENVKLDEATQKGILPFAQEINKIEEFSENLKYYGKQNPELLRRLVDDACGSDQSDFEEKNLNEILVNKLKERKAELEKKNFELLDKLEISDKNCKELENQLEKFRETEEKYKNIIKSLEFDLQDEKDASHSKTEKLNQLEKKNKKHEEKLSEMNALKNRLDEVETEKNMIIQSNKEIEEYKDNKYKILEAKNKTLEAELQKLSKQIAGLIEENSAIGKKYEEVCKENAQLNDFIDVNAKLSANESHKSGFSQSSDDLSMISSSISEQMSTSLQSEQLILQLENRRLSIQIDQSLQDLETEKSKLSTEVEALRSERETLKNQSNNDTNELKKLLEAERKRSIDFERKLKSAKKKLEERRAMNNSLNEMSIKEDHFKSKISALESDKRNALREVHEQSQLVKKKSAELEKATKNINELRTKIQNLENNEDRKNIIEFLQENNDANTVKKSPKNKLGREDKKTLNEDQIRLRSLIKTFEQTEKNNLVKSGEKPSPKLEDLKKQCERLTRDKNALKKELEDSKRELRRLNDSMENLENIRAKLEDEVRSLNLNNDTGENEKLKEDFQKLFKFSQNMAKEYKKATVELKKLPNYQLEVDAKNNKIIELEVQLNERNHSYNVLAKINRRLEEDRKSLMEHSNCLVTQLAEAHNQAKEDQKNYHITDQKKAEEYNNLRRQKEKLEEKLFEQFKNMENHSASKKKNSGRNFLVSKAVRLLSRSRKSLAESDSPPTERSHDFEFIKNYQSDVSLERSCVSDFGLNLSVSDKPRNRKSVDMFDGFNASDFSFYHNPRTRKSLDFEIEDPDATLHEDSREEDKEEDRDHSNNKISSLDEVKAMCGEPIYQNSTVTVRPDSRTSSVYSDQGCV